MVQQTLVQVDYKWMSVSVSIYKQMQAIVRSGRYRSGINRYGLQYSFVVFFLWPWCGQLQLAFSAPLGRQMYGRLTNMFTYFYLLQLYEIIGTTVSDEVSCVPVLVCGCLQLWAVICISYSVDPYNILIKFPVTRSIFRPGVLKDLYVFIRYLCFYKRLIINFSIITHSTVTTRIQQSITMLIILLLLLTG